MTFSYKYLPWIKLQVTNTDHHYWTWNSCTTRCIQYLFSNLFASVREARHTFSNTISSYRHSTSPKWITISCEKKIYKNFYNGLLFHTDKFMVNSIPFALFSSHCLRIKNDITRAYDTFFFCITLSVILLTYLSLFPSFFFVLSNFFRGKFF